MWSCGTSCKPHCCVLFTVHCIDLFLSQCQSLLMCASFCVHLSCCYLVSSFSFAPILQHLHFVLECSHTYCQYRLLWMTLWDILVCTPTTIAWYLWERTCQGNILHWMTALSRLLMERNYTRPHVQTGASGNRRIERKSEKWYPKNHSNGGLTCRIHVKWNRVVLWLQMSGKYYGMGFPEKCSSFLEFRQSNRRSKNKFVSYFICGGDCLLCQD